MLTRDCLAAREKFDYNFTRFLIVHAGQTEKEPSVFMKASLLYRAAALLLAACCIAGCKPSVYSAPPAPSAAPLASATPAPPGPAPTPSPENTEEAFRAALEGTLPDLPELVIEDYNDLVANRSAFFAYSGQVARAVVQAMGALELPTGAMEGLRIFEPEWKFIAALYLRYGTGVSALLAKACTLEVENTGVNVRLDTPELLRGKAPAPEIFSITLALAYLNTIYDAEGEEIPYVHPELEEAYLVNLQDPLPGAHIKNGWYNDRDKGARKHTGTDIRSPEDTEIFSCTDGTVLYVGANAGAGNYVVVRDDLGYEYHYYHMVRMTDFLVPGDRVKKGEVLGHVGNTGNSSANHLHLGIISPTYTYVNPYLVLRDMRKLQR